MGPKAPGRKEKMAAKAAQLEAQRREQEEKEERERLEQERLLQQEKEREAKRKREETEIMEKASRDEILQETCDFFYEVQGKSFEHRLEKREREEWDRYVACDRLPYPNEVPSMNTYLYLWHDTEDTARMEMVFTKNETMLQLLDLLQDYIEEPLDATEQKINNWKEVRKSYRKELGEKLDLACFHMIRDIEALFVKINYWEAEFSKSSDNIHLWMWAWMVKSIAPSAPKPAPAKTFGASTVKLPGSYAKSQLILRVLHTNYDHFSDKCRTWEEPPNPIDHDLYDETTMWHDVKVQLITENYESLQEAEEVPCWYELLEDDIEETFELDELSGMETNRTEVESNTQQSLTTEASPRQDIEELPDGQKDIELEESPKVENETMQPSTSSQNKVYVGTYPIENKPEYYRITSEGEIDIVKNNKGQTEVNYEEYEWSDDTDFEDWVSLKDPVDLDYDSLLLDAFYGNGITNVPGVPETKELPRQAGMRTLADLLKETTPRTGGLASLNLSETVRKYLSEMLEITIASEKKKVEEEDYGKERVYKSLTKRLEEVQSKYMEAYKKELKVTVSEFELNLRKFVILGGVYHIDLIHQVPQPHKHKDGTVIQVNYGEYNITKEDYFFKYVPPLVTEEDENEEDDNKPPVDDDIDQLISVDIQVPETVLWFETPAPYLWDADKKMWSSDNLYDVRYNEEKQVLTFRIGKTSPIGIASFRFYNLPYQTWEIRPSADWKETKSIIFSLTASTVVVEYLIQGDMVSLNSLQNATGAALDDIIGKPFAPNQLMRIMRQAGLDLFPGWDAFLYIEGNSAKKKVLEEHVYLSMAMFSPSYQYTWSRWNMPAGLDRIVLQMRESMKPKETANYSMLMSTSHRAALVNCTEVSPSFSEEAVRNMGYQPDMFNLIESTATDKAKKRAKKSNLDVIFTLYYMLVQTKILSFS